MTATLIANVTCVAIGGRGLLIEGPPGSGKSSLALALLDRGAVLVGDDGIALERRGDRLHALPPPNITGLIEIRGVGIVERPCAPAPLALAIELAGTAPHIPGLYEKIIPSKILAGLALPCLPMLAGDPLLALRAEYAMTVHGLT